MVSQNLRFRFTLVSYNILSQTLLNEHHYLYDACNPRDLEWPKRGHKIVKELLSNQADIICLQEVESEHLKSLYRPKLAHYGYECLYKKKTGYKVDGCAIFYKSKLFHLLNHKSVEFNRTDVAHLLDRDNVGIIAILKPRLQSKSESSHLIIANTHLIYNPNRGDIKLAQMKFFLSALEHFSRQSCAQSEDPARANASQPGTATRLEEPECWQHPMILCGDLNSAPDSEVSRYILKNAIKRKSPPASRTTGSPPNDEDKHSERNENADEAANSNKGQVRREPDGLAESPHLCHFEHQTQFRSVFPTRNRAGQKYVSTFSNEIVDYIFYTPRLRLDSYKELLTENELQEVGPIPNGEFPSDHITLGAKFVLK